ncbi:DUF5977 domain-containing protein [Flavobacterium sp. 140616W15]|uniref:DUF5977 domain-containing protein n=1 Tax=Flavobacterium sp. 140616W15 TaxID=2478552 RepID=UPI000F0CA5E1|nr:DUF5977 domain-containing protein [Flavobacterium sp. 140616W15]AYN03758.1 hypothetical protein EAG11_05885 [Flavobacterium sp. 140616W15]
MPATDENGGSTNVTFDSEIFFRPLPFTLGGNFTYTREFSDSFHTLSANEFRTGNIGAYGCPISSITASWEEYSEFKEVITTKLVGGVRIKSIENFDQIGAITPVSIKRFDYQEENILNKEGLGSYKRYIILTDNPGIQESTPVCSTSALYNNNIGGSPNITYGKIIETEINPNTSVTNGKTEYYYQNIISERTIIDAPTTFRHPLFILHYPYSTLMLKYTLNIYDFSYYKNDSWNYGSLINTITYKRDTSNTLKKIKSVENKYTILKQLELPYNLVFNIFSDPYGPYDPNFTPEPYIQGKSIDYYSAQFFYFTGKVSLGKKVITSTTETNYDENEKITTKKTISYSFENPVHNQVTRMQTSNSNNERLETKYLYPQDAIVASEPFVNELKDKNIVGVPLTTLSYNGVTKLSEQKTVYDKSLATSNLLLPRYIYANKGVGNINNSTDKKITFDQYDDKGNLVQYTLEGGTPVSIIWGYNKTQPIAKIENATYASIPLETITSLQALSNADDDNCMSANCTEQLLRNGLDAFRATLPNAFITTYTYNPLVGVTSITDPSRISTYYHYDKFNRLQYIKDQDLNIVQTYYYNYKGQIIDYLLPEASIYKNVAISKIYTKNDCSTGASASVMYKVAIGTFSSSISQADADAQAQADISKNGQAYANNNGVCSYRNKGISKLFTKNDCGETGIPATMYYTIAEDRYNSTISQADADAQAQVNLNNFGQEYVNANGYCTYQNEELRGNFSLFSEDFGLFKVAYHVPSGKFTSTISQIDADEIAQQGLSQCQNEYSCLMVECQELLEEDGMAITNYDCDNISFTIMPFEEEN